MSAPAIGGLGIAVLFALLFLRVPVWAALAMVGFGGISALAGGGIEDPEQTLVHQRSNSFEHVERFTFAGNDRFGGFQHATPGEDGQAAEETLLLGSQQIVTPGNRPAHGLLPGRLVFAMAGKQL